MTMSVEPFTKNAESLPFTERAVREELAAAHRLSARYGMIDLTHTHFSARVPGSPDHFLISPYGRWFHEVTASELVKVDGRGNVVGEAGASIAGFIIHEAVYSVRPDVHAIFHTHTRAGVAVAALECGLLPISQFALRFHGRVAYHDYEGATLVEGERDRLRRSAADPNHVVIILRNHGLVTLGPSVADAFCRMYYLDRACQVQIDCLHTGKDLVTPSETVCRRTADYYEAGDDKKRRMTAVWAALLRLIANETPDYRD